MRAIRRESVGALNGRLLRRVRRAVREPDVGPEGPEGGVRAAWVSSKTGVPLEVAREALLTLAAREPCRLQVSDDGELVFRFLRPRSTATERVLARVGERARAWRDPLVATLSLVCVPPLALLAAGGASGLAIALSLVDGVLGWVAAPLVWLAWATAAAWAFVGLFVLAMATLAFLGVLVLVLAVVVGWMASVDVVASPLEPIAKIIALLFVWYGAFLVTLVGRYTLRATRDVWAQVALGERAQWAPTLWRNLGGLLLGPPAPRRDPFADRARLVQWIEARRGYLIESDLVALFGWTLEEADSALVRILLDYGGTILVADNSALVYRFPSFHGASTPLPAPVWEIETEPTRPFFDCDRRFLRGVVVLAALPLLGALALPWIGGTWFPWGASFFGALAPIVGSAAPEPGTAEELAWSGLVQGAGLWPWIGLGLVLVGRVPLDRKRRAERDAFLARLPLLRAAWESPDGAWVAADDVRSDEVARLEGTIDAEAGDRDPRGRPAFFVRFPAFARDEEAAFEARKGASERFEDVAGLQPELPSPIAAGASRGARRAR